jgi:hypothetical protein
MLSYQVLSRRGEREEDKLFVWVSGIFFVKNVKPEAERRFVGVAGQVEKKANRYPAARWRVPIVI